MNLLLDTQAFLWFENGDIRIPASVKQAIAEPSNIKFISMAAFWEIAIKNSLGKLELHIPFDDLLTLKGYTHLHISGNHLKKVRTLPYHHRDPFDRLLIAQAMHEGLVIISADKQFDLYGIKRIW